MADITIEAAGRRVAVRRLTVGDVYSLIDADEKATEGEIDLVALLAAPERIPLHALRGMTNLTEEDIKALTADDLDRLVAAAKEANPHFFRVWAAIRQTADRLTQSMIGEISPPPSAG